MKYIYAFLSIFLAVAVISCASRPVLSVPEISSPMETPPEIQTEPTDPFERAVWNVKMDTPLVKKYFEPAAGVPETGRPSVEDIAVKGELLFNGNEFHVIYDLANAAQIGENIFRVQFFLESLSNGAVRHDELFWRPAENEAGLLLAFDDDYWHTWRQYFDMFDTFGAKVTFFIQGSLEPGINIAYLSDSDPAAAQTALAGFCIEALGRGHDLGFHSANHYDLTKVSRSTFNNETIEAAEAFFKAGIPFSSFAFPFGFSQPWMREALAPVFPLIRGYGSNIRFYNTETVNNGYIISKAIDNILYPDDSKFENDIRLILLAAKFTGNYIVPFTTHDISDNAEWGIKPRRLEYLLKTAQELRLRFYSYRIIQDLFPSQTINFH